MLSKELLEFQNESYLEMIAASWETSFKLLAQVIEWSMQISALSPFYLGNPFHVLSSQYLIVKDSETADSLIGMSM